MSSRDEIAKKALAYHCAWIDRDEADDKRTLSFVIADFAIEVVESQRPAIEAEAVREFVRRVNETVNDETAGAYGVDWDTAIECVAAEMGISLEGE